MFDILLDIASGALPPSHILDFILWRIREEISIWYLALKMFKYESLDTYKKDHPLLPIETDLPHSPKTDHFIYVNPQSW